MVKRVKYGHVRVEDTRTVIRLHIGNVYRDLSVSYARILAGKSPNFGDLKKPAHTIHVQAGLQ